MRRFNVIAGWMSPEEKIGTCEIENARGRETISFSFDPGWISRHPDVRIDPMLTKAEGRQFPAAGTCFGFLSDIAPDRWGRTLMQRREASDAKEEGRPQRTLMDSDYILGVHDAGRIGGIRLADPETGGYLSDRESLAAPPMEKLRELESAVAKLESGSSDMKKCLKDLLDPGSSLGGARPKANIMDEKGSLWIAKFPSLTDSTDVGAWEMVAHNLAARCGLKVPEARALRLSPNGTTFLSKRFDRNGPVRVHYASAMTMTGRTDGEAAGYMDIADAIEQISYDPVRDLREIWARMTFSICISNTDDHLRNHGFLLNGGNWELSPAFDINPNIDKQHMDLAISSTTEKSLREALEVAEFFRIGNAEASSVIHRIQSSVKDFWQYEASSLGISQKEQRIMKDAFEEAYRDISPKIESVHPTGC